MVLLAALLAEIHEDTPISQNVDILPQRFQSTREVSVIKITIACAACRFRLVPNEGSAFSINAGKAIPDDSVYVEEVPLDTGRTWNLQCPDPGELVLKMLRVEEIGHVTS